MKKFFYAVAFALVIGLASCGGNEIDKKIDRLEELKEQAEKLQTEDVNDPAVQQKAIEIASEAMQIGAELTKEHDKMTEAQIERLKALKN
ncbi:MAG: hypothetical protein J1E38_00560 [Paramuribaculum sp.]|nr:hypothetical protein [Paramuribaculum sp.]